MEFSCIGILQREYNHESCLIIENNSEKKTTKGNIEEYDYPTKKVDSNGNGQTPITTQNIDNPTPIQPVSSDLYTQPPIKKSSKPLIAGIILILAGVLGLFLWAELLLNPSIVVNVVMTTIEQQGLSLTAEQVESIFLTCGVIGCILSVFAILGGIMAVQRKLWWLALLGSILGIFILQPVFISSFLSLIGMILLIISRKEFEENL